MCTRPQVNRIALQTEHRRPGEPVRDGPSGRLPSPKKELQSLITRRKADQGDPAASGRQQATGRITGRIPDGGAASGHRRRVHAAIREDERRVINIHSSPVINIHSSESASRLHLTLMGDCTSTCAAARSDGTLEELRASRKHVVASALHATSRLTLRKHSFLVPGCTRCCPVVSGEESEERR